jgi:MFS family permease
MERYWDDLLEQQTDPQSFSWLSLRALFSSVNDILARGSSALVNDTRQRWVAAQRAAGVEATFKDFVIDHLGADEVSFIVLGDPGEADDSQYAVVKPLLAAGAKTDFMIICSDVVYPAGDVNDYVDAFYIPYAAYESPIYALPGNHDWYDSLNGFMYHFCAADPLPDVTYNRASYGGREWLARRLWRKALAPKRERLATYRRRMALSETVFRKGVQPASYFAVDTGPILIVAIDTGVTGEVDREQGDWLRWITATRDKPKILLTGRPLHVDNTTKPGTIEDNLHHPERFRYVDEIVRNADNRFVAVVGGDVHNYQRYETSDSEGREVASIVSGGGGAYLSNTHRIPPHMTDDELTRLVRCYPTRAESIKLYAARFVPMLWGTLLLILALVGTTLAAVALLEFFDWPEPGWSGFVVALLAVAVSAAMARPDIPPGGALIGADPRPFAVWIVDSALFGVALALLGSWLLGDRLSWAVLVWFAAVVPVAAAALFDNAIEQRSRRLKIGWGVALALTGLALVGAAVVLAVLEEGGWVAVAAGLIAVALLLPVLVFVPFALLRGDDEPPPPAFDFLPSRPKPRARQHPYQWALTYIAAVVALLGVSVVAWWQPRAAAIAVLVVATICYLVALPVVAFLAERRSRATVGFYLIPAAVAGVLIAFALAWTSGDTVVLRVPVATLCVLLAVAAGVALTYLAWLRAIPLLWQSSDRNGLVDLPQVVAHLYGKFTPPPLDLEDAADVMGPGEALPEPSSRTERIARMVTPPGAERSVLHRFASEVFEPLTPPFYKNFLRVDCTTTTTMKITAFGVTGETSIAEEIDSVSISLDGR